MLGFLFLLLFLSVCADLLLDESDKKLKKYETKIQEVNERLEKYTQELDRLESELDQGGRIIHECCSPDKS